MQTYQSKKFRIVSIVFLLFIIGIGVYYFKPKETEIKFDFPISTKVDPLLGMSCKAIVGNSMYGTDIGSDKGIHAYLSKGTDEIAVELDSKGKFSFITKASVGMGQAISDQDWVIVKNDEEYLIAVLDHLGDPIPIHNSHNTFMLNKENGVALWTKTRVTNLGSDTPESQSYLLK